MVELPHRGLFAVILHQVPAVFLVELRECRVLHGMDRDDAWVLVVEGRGVHELAGQLLTLGAGQVDGQQFVARTAGWRRGVLAPTLVGVTEVLPPAIAGDPPRAALVRRAVSVLDAHPPLAAALGEGQVVEPVHEVAGHLGGKLHVGLLVLSPCDLDAHARR